MILKNFLLCLIFFGGLTAVQSTDAPISNNIDLKKPDHHTGVIYLNDGTKIRGEIISRSPSSIEVREPQAEEARKIELNRILLIDDGDSGVVIPEKKTAGKQEAERPENLHFEFGPLLKAAYLHSGDLSQYAEDLGRYLANQQTGSNGAPFTAQQQSTLGLTVGVGGELRIIRGKFRLDLSGNYYNSRNVVTKFENQPDPERVLTIAPVSVSGISTINYSPLGFWGGQVWTGVGAGFFWQSLELDFTSPSGSTKSTFTGWAFGVIGKIEYNYPLFGLNFVIGLEASFAPITRYESQGIALINGTNGKVTASGHSGGTIYLGVFYQF